MLDESVFVSIFFPFIVVLLSVVLRTLLTDTDAEESPVLEADFTIVVPFDVTLLLTLL